MKQTFTIRMNLERTTSGGQRLYVVSPEHKQDAVARNIYITKDAFPPDIKKPDVIDVAISYDDGR